MDQVILFSKLAGKERVLTLVSLTSRDARLGVGIEPLTVDILWMPTKRAESKRLKDMLQGRGDKQLQRRFLPTRYSEAILAKLSPGCQEGVQDYVGTSERTGNDVNDDMRLFEGQEQED